MTTSKRIVVFDFDGVIFDSMHAAYSTWQEGGATINLAQYKERFHGNINDAAKPADMDFYAEYRKKVPQLIVFPGMAEVISTLAAAHTLVINSSTPSDIIEEILEDQNLSKYFAAVLGNDVSHSKTEKLRMVFDRYDTSAENCVFITDTLGDLDDANEAKVQTIAVTWGFHDRAALGQGSPTKIANNPKELPELVASLL